MLKKADNMIGSNLSVVSKENIKKKIKSFGKYKNDAFFWNNGVLAYALKQYGFDGKNLKRLKKKKVKIAEIDDALYFYANFDWYSKGDHQKIYNFILSYSTSKNGSIVYRRNKPYIFIDALGMICPYLIKYYHDVKKDEKILDIVFNQFFNFFNNGFDTHSGLPYHGFDLDEKNKLGIIGWGRAIGWLLFGIAECLDYFPKNDTRIAMLKTKVQNLVQEVFGHIRKDGGFGWQVQALDGPADTSATAMIGYAVIKMIKIGFLEGNFSELLSKIEEFLANNVTDSGAVINSSAECQGFSMYPQKYENNSWGQAFTMMFFADRRNKLD